MKNITIRRDGINVTVGKLSSTDMCIDWLERVFGRDGKIATLSGLNWKANCDTRPIAIVNLGADSFDVLLDGDRDQPGSNTAALLGDLPSGIYYLHTPKGQVKITDESRYERINDLLGQLDTLSGKLGDLRDEFGDY